MLVQMHGGYVDPDRVEAIMPSANGKGYVLALRGGALIAMVGVRRDRLRKELEKAGLVNIWEEEEACEEE